MHICSFVIYCQNYALQDIVAMLDTLANVDRYGEASNKIVIVIETQTEQELTRIVNKIQQCSGVLAVNLAYQHSQSGRGGLINPLKINKPSHSIQAQQHP